ncbi:terminase small subunit [Schauerella aestuarii]|uniref:terminase small subunit n=1 Tax=Schauerella aestuarii TaxID=2511204 RepID=UPI001369BBB7|nr:terminase small subunit [Achromobacter aestuarii]MYZ44206.1 terminase small subunit [Achromobacter aestuarii]
MSLSAKQRKFVEAKAQGASNKQAAISAGYSLETAGPAGSRLAKHQDVVAALARKAGSGDLVKPVNAAPAASAAATNAEAPPPDDQALTDALYSSDPKRYLTQLMNDLGEEPKLRLEAAKALMPYVHAKVPEPGKKDAAKDAAKKAGGGKFSSTAPPLRMIPGGR